MINEYGAAGGMRIGRGNRSTRGKPTALSFPAINASELFILFLKLKFNHSSI
jgi:hypothetical protein